MGNQPQVLSNLFLHPKIYFNCNIQAFKIPAHYLYISLIWLCILLCSINFFKCPFPLQISWYEGMPTQRSNKGTVLKEVCKRAKPISCDDYNLRLQLQWLSNVNKKRTNSKMEASKNHEMPWKHTFNIQLIPNLGMLLVSCGFNKVAEPICLPLPRSIPAR